MMRNGKLLVLTLGVCSQVLFAAPADDGASALLEALPPGSISEESQTGPGTKNLSVDLQGKLKLTDPFLIQFLSTWQTQKDLSLDTNRWAMQILEGKYEEASHQLSVVRAEDQKEFDPAVVSAGLYLYYRMGLAQTFFNEWVAALSTPSYANSRVESALEATVAPTLDQWLLDNAILVKTDQAAIIAGLGTQHGLAGLTLKAWAALQKRQPAKEVLEKLPPENKLRFLLAQVLVADYVRQEKFAEAGRAMKTYLEQSAELKGDAVEVSQYYIQIARMLYAIGALEKSEAFYERIPNGSPHFVTAREELAWVWLHLGKNEKLRGWLKTTDTPLLDAHFSPEVGVVAAISNLKLCYYEKVSQNLKSFLNQYEPWAKKIEVSLAAGDPPRWEHPDFYVELAEKTLAKREEEAKRFAKLESQSQAAQGTVGIQIHWTRAEKQAVIDQEVAKKEKAREYRRQWANAKYALTEAIRKMQFVKVEFLSQLRTYTATAAKGVKVAEATGNEKKFQTDANNQVYPFDGVVWPDELFSLQGIAQMQCLAKGQEK